MTSDLRNVPEGTLVVSERLPSSSVPGKLIRTMSGGTTFETKHLHEYCYSAPTPLSHDIAALLGAVRLADRAFVRQHSRGWNRQLTVELPVFELSTWRTEEVSSSLTDSLQYLTGDTWNFCFTKRRRKAHEPTQKHVVSAPNSAKVFVPFSHGLDSFAQSELLRNREIVEVVPVNINSSRKSSEWRYLGRRSRSQAVPVSSQVDEPHHSEASFRSRPFIYDLMAAYGAAMSDASRVLVPENGQGSLGSSLVPLGGEAPHRSCHPGFTSRLSTFVLALTGKRVVFEHPALYQTKGQVLMSLSRINSNAPSWLGTHPSCSYDARHAHKLGRQVHCGICGNCMLRRMSTQAAGIADTTEYRVTSLSALSLRDGAEDCDLSREINAYEDIAYNSCRSMQRLADLAEMPDSTRVWAEADSIARAHVEPVEEVRKKIMLLLQQHKIEWKAFVERSGAFSWVANFARP